MRNHEKKEQPGEKKPSPDAVLQPELFPLLPQALVQKLSGLPVISGHSLRPTKAETKVRPEIERSGAA